MASWVRKHLPSKYFTIRRGGGARSESSNKSQRTVSQPSSINTLSTILQSEQNLINQSINQPANPIESASKRTNILHKTSKIANLDMPPQAVGEKVEKQREEKGEKEEATSHISSKGSGSVQSISDAGSHESNSTFMYSHEPFETFKLKIIQLCCDIGWGEPSEVEHMKGGSYHRIIGVKFDSREPQDYIFRIARMQEDRDLSRQVKDEVATHQYLSQLLPIPKVAASDETKNNVLQCSYIMQERISGKTHEATYYNLSLTEKLQITSKVAEFIQKMETIRFDKPGRLAAKPDTPVLSDISNNSTQNIEIAGFREGKMAVEGDWPISEAQPFKQLMSELLVYQRAQYDDGNNNYSLKHLDALILIAEQMEKAGLMRNVDMQCALWHWDFAGRNVMIEETTNPECVSTESQEQQNEVVPSQSKIFQHKIRVENSIHKTSITVELPAGTTYNHTFKVRDALTSTSFDHSFDITTPQTETIKPIPLGSQPVSSTKKNWEVSGILDWDNALSVPLVISRQPPQWLWCEEENRSTDFTGNFDIPPTRELTQDELLIKGHFDQIMSRADPTYIEDAYGRGVWLRRLARMALDGFGGYGGYERAEILQEEWEKHFMSISEMPAKKEDLKKKDDEEEDSSGEEECGDGSDVDQEESVEEDGGNTK